MFFISRAAVILALLTVFIGGPLSAQVSIVPVTSGSQNGETATSEEPLTQEAVRELVARMSDDQVRSMLLDRLDAVAEAEAEAAPPPKSFFGQVNRIWTAFYSNPLDAVMKLPTLFQKQGEAFRLFAADFGGAAGVLAMLAITAGVLAVGFAAEFISQKLTKRWQGNKVPSQDATLKESLHFLFRRFMGEIFGLVVFYFTIRLVGRAVLDPHQLVFIAPLVTYLIWWPRLGAAVSRFILAPHKASLRMVSLDDHWARFLYKNLIGLILLSGFTIFMVGFNMNAGHALSETRIGFWLDTSVYLYIIYIAWTARAGLTELMRGSDPDRTDFDELVAKYYPAYVISVAVGMWVLVSILSGLDKVELLLKGAHYGTMFWLIVMPALDLLVRGLVRHLIPPMIGEGQIAQAAYRSTKRSYIRIGRVLIGGLVVMLIANSWNMDIADFTSNRQGFGASLIEFLMTAAIGYILYEVVSLWINRRLAREFTSEDQSEDAAAGEGGGVGGSRLATVLPLLRVTAQSAIAVIFGLLAIGSLGIDITPLLAGAGILGLAIGFGAQKLVTDIVSGIFFLIDDAFRVGEYVEVDGATTGTVEKISIRSFQLRHHRGPVHTIPYGEIPKLTNYSRDWVIMKLKFTVPFDTDPNKVKKIFKKIGAEMISDPLYEEGFLEPFKSQGVFDFDDVGMIIRGKFMAKPGQQFTIRKEIYNRVKKEFADAGIDFARREVRVAIPALDEDHDHLSANEKTAITAAAAAAVQQQLAADEPPQK